MSFNVKTFLKAHSNNYFVNLKTIISIDMQLTILKYLFKELQKIEEKLDWS